MSAPHPALKSVLNPTALQWFALVLLVISVCINYADRGNLGIAATHIETDLRLDPQRIGDLSTAFFWTYGLFQLIAGKLIDRWNVNWIYAIGFLVWSGATGATGLVDSFWAIFFLRFLLGAGESIAYPAYSKIIATYFPEHLRGTANAMIDAGSKLGPALGVMAGVEALKWFSWRGMFILIGVTSLVWLLPWSIVAAKLPSRKLERASAWAPSYRELSSQRPFWGTVVGLFCGNYTWYFYLSWLPYYFERVRHYHKDELALMASLPFWAVAISSMLFGLLADAMIRRGREPGRLRQSFMCLGLLGCCGFMFSAVLVPSPLFSDFLLVMAAVSMGVWSSNHWAFTQRLSGQAAAGKWTAFQNCIAAFAGVAGAWVTGHVLGWTHSFFAAFAIACAVLLVGIASYWFVVGTPREIAWRSVLDSDDKTAYIKEVS